ncbi:hypothetical protein H131_13138 [Lysinibacillus sphaericus OT4b.31]|uniref:Uncharacterized protein n=2 Tax=Bacillaceae TaxID=186817 RepID=R7ZCL6_LYSSH|nr:hypothetical protein H131_13138 [Lysinibacillus sphaericus OT4b.31]
MKRGGKMQFTDDTRTFDTEEIEAAVKNPQREGDERDMLNAFARYAYFRYKQIRNCVNPRKCKYMWIDKVREQLKSPAKIQRVCHLLNITDDEVHYIVNFVKKHLKYVK